MDEFQHNTIVYMTETYQSYRTINGPPHVPYAHGYVKLLIVMVAARYYTVESKVLKTTTHKCEAKSHDFATFLKRRMPYFCAIEHVTISSISSMLPYTISWRMQSYVCIGV